MELVTKEGLRLPLLIGCGQLSSLPNETAGFFYQYLLKHQLIFLHEASHEGKVAPETTSFGWE